MREAIQYVVTATCIDEATRERYVQWLVDRHVAMVLATGLPTHARVVKLDGGCQAQTQYEFSSRESLEQYLEQHAPALRKEGADFFGASVTFTRTIGTVSAQW